MERSIAVELAAQLKKLDGPLGAAAEVVEKIKDENQKRAFRRAIAETIGTIYTELQIPIGREYPDLLPDEDDRRRTEP